MKKNNTIAIIIYSYAFLIINFSCDKDSVTLISNNIIPSKDSAKVNTNPSKESIIISNEVIKGNYYVALNGNDSNPGTFNKPFQSIEKALSLVLPGQLILVRGGKYPLKNLSAAIALKISGRSGTSGNYIKIWAYPGERIEINCSFMTIKDQGPIGLAIGSYLNPADANFIHIKGFDIKNTPNPINPATLHGINSAGIRIYASNCILEDCSSSGNGGPGIEVDGANNQIINCDSYNNYDPNTYMHGVPHPGDNADGFVVGNTNTRSITIFKGCRSWNNSDDGFDTNGTEGSVNFSNCWAFHNGYIPNTEVPIIYGGNGFKLGKTSSYSDIRRNVNNCIASLNKGEGFMQNEALCGMDLVNNTSFNNKIEGFSFNLKANITLKYNISVDPNSCYAPFAVQINNSWNNNLSPSNSDFESVDTKQLLFSRKADGNLPNITFLKVKPSSLLKDLGAK